VKVDFDDIAFIEETAVTVRSYRHRTTVPSRVFKHLDLKQGDMIRWIVLRDGSVILSKLDIPMDSESSE
jgi:bifunctional DNA-binding transcriptional regulator/antitoxin component of YhaV-PrlF toxin-antitoxin module